MAPMEPIEPLMDAGPAPAGTRRQVARPAAGLVALLAELDAWPARATKFGDACDRLSDLLAASEGECPDALDVDRRIPCRAGVADPGPLWR